MPRWAAPFPTLDFAGGTVVHVTSGVSALVCALYLGKTIGVSERADAAAQRRAELHRRLPALGGLVRIQRRQRAGRRKPRQQRLCGHAFRCRRGGAGLGCGEWLTRGKASVLGAISGAVAGLVAITPASGFVAPMPALVIGLIAGVFCFLMVAKVKGLFGYDDSLDVFGVHGAGGTIGALLTGVFASQAVNAIYKDSQGNALPVGLIDGNAHQLMNQTGGRGYCLGPGDRRHARHFEDCGFGGGFASSGRTRDSGPGPVATRGRRLQSGGLGDWVGKTDACHPERSEGSLQFASRARRVNCRDPSLRSE